MRVQWEKTQSVSILRCGGVAVATVSQSHMIKGHSPRWTFAIHLPGLVVNSPLHPTEMSAMKETELLVQQWFTRVLS